MSRFFFITIFQLIAVSVLAQKAPVDTIAKLSDDLTEISALVRTNKGHIWAINDSGNQPEVFKLSPEGKILKRVFVANAKNVDWEELACDNSGRIFIGDFGNNRNARQDQAIYVVLEDDLLSMDTVNSAKTTFAYADQKEFPPVSLKRNYDMEAMVFHDNELWLFSKNRTEPFSGYTYLYKVPANPGNYNLEKQDSLFLGEGPRELYQVTGAAISPDDNLLVLMSYDKFFLIHDYAYNDPFGGILEQVDFENASQKESVCFINDTTLLVADEQSVLGGGYLYKTNIAQNRRSNSLLRRAEVSIEEKQFADTLNVVVETQVRGKIYYEFFDGEGMRVSYGVLGYYDRGTHTIEIIPPFFPNGTYMLNVQIGKRPHAFFVYRFTDVDWDEVKGEFEQRKKDLQNRQTSEPEK